MRDGGGPELIGEPETLERFGGLDIDTIVLDLFRARVPGLADADDDPGWEATTARLCALARHVKERLSTEVETVVAVGTPAGTIDLTVTRAELEAVLRPPLEDTVHAVERTVASAGLNTYDVSRILLVGGSSRIPLVRKVISDGCGRPVVMNAEREHTIALGAARAAVPSGGRRLLRRHTSG